MKLGPVTKLKKRNKTTSNNLATTSCRQIVTLLLLDQFGAIRKPDSGRIICKTYIFINSNLSSYKNWKQNWKMFYTALILLIWLKLPSLPKNADFFAKKMLTSAKLRRPWYRKVHFLELHMCVNVRTKFQVFSLIPSSFRQGRGGGGRG